MIGIFDSGIGGLTVVKALLECAPKAPFIYLGDTARTPYGNKSPDIITAYALEDAKFLVAKGATSLIIACNSASAVATDALRKAYPGMSIYEVIMPAVDAAVATGAKRIGVIGTRATISSGVYQERLEAANAELTVLAKACPLFVPLAEEGWLDERETKQIARRYLSDFHSHPYDALILGCTHYPLLKQVIQHAVGRKVKLIDSAAAVVDAFMASGSADASSTGEQTFYLTDVSPHSVKIAQSWLGRRVNFEKAEL